MLTQKPQPPELETLRRLINGKRNRLEELGAETLSIFGSCAYGKQRPGSDIDLVVRLRPGFGYFDLAEMKGILEAEIGVEVNPIIEPRAGFPLETVHVF